MMPSASPKGNNPFSIKRHCYGGRSQAVIYASFDRKSLKCADLYGRPANSFIVTVALFYDRCKLLMCLRLREWISTEGG